MEDGGLLFIVESFEMVGLHTVRRQHRSHGSGILSHEIVSQSVVEFVSLLVSPVLSLSELGIAFLLSELQVHLLSGTEHISSLSLMLLLCLLEDLIKVYGLLVIRTTPLGLYTSLRLIKPLLVLGSVLFVNLLLDPLLLLLLLQSLPLLLHYMQKR